MINFTPTAIINRRKYISQPYHRNYPNNVYQDEEKIHAMECFSYASFSHKNSKK